MAAATTTTAAGATAGPWGLAPGGAVGPWQLESLLASGPGSQTWLVRRKVRPEGCFVAKLVAADDRAAVARLRGEGATLLALPSAALPAPVDWLAPGRDGLAALVIERKPGLPLAQALTTALDSDAGRARLASVAAQALAALRAMHAVDIVHGDLHGGNILLDEVDRVSILDLGLASRPGAVAAGPGLPSCAAPERLRGEPSDARDDLFALAMTLWSACGLAPLWPDYPTLLPADADRPPVPEGPAAPLLRVLAAMARPRRDQRPAHAEAAARAWRGACAEAGVPLRTPGEAAWRALADRPLAAQGALPPRTAAVCGPSGAGRTSALLAAALHHAGPSAWLRGRDGAEAAAALGAQATRLASADVAAAPRAAEPAWLPVEGGLGGLAAAAQARDDRAIAQALAALGPQGLLLVDDLGLLSPGLAEAALHALDAERGDQPAMLLAADAPPPLLQGATAALAPLDAAAVATLLAAADGGRTWDLALAGALAAAVGAVRRRLWGLAAEVLTDPALTVADDRVECTAADAVAIVAHAAARLASPPPPPQALTPLLAHLLADSGGLVGAAGDPAQPLAPTPATLAAWPWLRARPHGGFVLDPGAHAVAAATVAPAAVAQAAAVRAAWLRAHDVHRALLLALQAAAGGAAPWPPAAAVLATARSSLARGDAERALTMALEWLHGVAAGARGVPEAGAIWSVGARALAALGRFDRAEALLACRPEAAAADPDALVEEADIAFRRGDFPRARAVADAVIAASGVPLGDAELPRPAAVALCLRAFAATWQGDLDAARADVALGAVAVAPWPELRAQIDYIDALLHYYAGQVPRARAGFAALVEAPIAPAITAAAHAGLGLCAQREGDLDAARRAYGESRTLAERAGDRSRVLNMTMNIATIDHESGDLGRALAGYDRVVVGGTRLGNAGAVVRARVNRGNLLSGLGLVEDACADLDAALPALEQTGNAYLEGNVCCVQAELARAAGRLEVARTWIVRAEARQGAVGAAAELAEFHLEHAWLALARGDTAAAARGAEQVEAAALTRGHDELVARALHVRARVALTALQEPTLTAREAARHLDTALGLLADAATRLPTGKRTLALRQDADRTWALAAAGRRGEARSLALATREQLDRLAQSLPSDTARRFAAAPALAGVRDVLALVLRLDDATASGATGSASGRSAERAVMALSLRLASEHDPERLLEALMDSAVALTGAERGFLLLDGREGEPDTAPGVDDLAVAVARNLDGETLRRPQHKLSRSTALEVFETGEPLLATDARVDPRLAEQHSVHTGNLRSILCVPLLLRGRTIGVLYVDNRFAAGAFSREHLGLLEALAGQAAVAIHAARLIARLRQREAELEQRRQEVQALNAKLRSELERTEDALSEARDQLLSERGDAARRSDYEHIRGDSPALHAMLRLLDRVRDHDFPVLVLGESGTGKELVARALHYSGRRRKGPFVAINCGALPETLLESELFGHVRGAFTGAVGDRRGLFEQAHGGTLLLDEIGEMPPSMQVKLLRVLQSGELLRVGGSASVRVDVRVVAATHRDLDRMVREGSFREDLLYRLRVVSIAVPPLRDRASDLELLCDYFLQRNREAGLGQVRRITKGALRRMRAHRWPGNIRELETFLKSACLFCDGDTLDEADIAPLLERAPPGPPAPADPQLAAAPLDATLDDIERAAVVARLEAFQGNKRKTAASLGVDRSTLYHKLRAWGVGGDDG